MLASFKRNLRAERDIIKRLKRENAKDQVNTITNLDRQSLETIYHCCRKMYRGRNCCINEKQALILEKYKNELVDNLQGGHVKKKKKRELVSSLKNLAELDDGILLSTVLTCFKY